MAYHRISFLAIDQVRANLTIDPYAQKEKTVGVFKDHRAATSISALNHKVAQWLFLSRKATITPDDGLGINGWMMSVYTEKNKNNVPSNESVTCVFDKRTGLHPFWSEYLFLSELMPSEKKYFKDESKLCYPLMIKKSGPSVYLEFIDPTTGNVQYTSDKFYRKDAYNMYLKNEQFKQAFDYTVDVSIECRIRQGLFRMINNQIHLVDTPTDVSLNVLEQQVDTVFNTTENTCILPTSDIENKSSLPIEEGFGSEVIVAEETLNEDDLYQSVF